MLFNAKSHKVGLFCTEENFIVNQNFLQKTLKYSIAITAEFMSRTKLNIF